MIRFVCPQCKQPLMEIDAGFQCLEHGKFPIGNGIPHLMPRSFDRAVEYFHGHWEHNSSTAYPPTKLAVAREFLAPLLGQQLSCGAILDVGCGDGVHAAICGENDSTNYCGIDISVPALNTAAQRNRDATFAEASAEELPFADGIFDAAFSYGVLAYTASPRQSFAEMVRVTKSGGLIGTWFYPKPSGLPAIVLRVVRSLVRISPGIIGNLIANAIVPFLGFLPTSSRISLRNATWAQCKEVVLVNIAPEQLWYPTDEDVLQLFRDAGVEIKEFEHLPRVTVWGVKR